MGGGTYDPPTSIDQTDRGGPFVETLLNLGISPDFATPLGVALFVLVYLIVLFGIVLLARFLMRRDERFAFVINRTFGSIFQVLSAFFGVEFNRPSPTNANHKLLESIKEDISDLKNSSASPAALDSETREQIVELFEKSLGGDFKNEIREQVELLIRQNFDRTIENESIEFFISGQHRLSRASSTVSIRGLLSLLIGIGFAAGALYILRQAVDELKPDYLANLTVATATYMIALRLSLAAFITLISYFFLSLYRASLLDNKYYQNEITNISMISAAMHVAYSTSDDDTKKSLVLEMAKLDRNAVVSSGKNASSNSTSAYAAIVEKLVEKLPGIK